MRFYFYQSTRPVKLKALKREEYSLRMQPNKSSKVGYDPAEATTIRTTRRIRHPGIVEVREPSLMSRAIPVELQECELEPEDW